MAVRWITWDFADWMAPDLKICVFRRGWLVEAKTSRILRSPSDLRGSDLRCEQGLQRPQRGRHIPVISTIRLDGLGFRSGKRTDCCGRTRLQVTPATSNTSRQVLSRRYIRTPKSFLTGPPDQKLQEIRAGLMSASGLGSPNFARVCIGSAMSLQVFRLIHCWRAWSLCPFSTCMKSARRLDF